MSGIGHNRGPSIEPGAGFRRVAWSKARTALMPTLPLEVVRLRVKRAERLGLPYKTYATIRAVSGHDIVGFLFSDNALDMRRAEVVPEASQVRLRVLGGAVQRLAALHAPKDIIRVLGCDVLDGAGRAPAMSLPWRAARDGLRAIAREAAVPLDGLIVVAATALEREWSGTAGFGGTIPRETFFLT